MPNPIVNSGLLILLYPFFRYSLVLQIMPSWPRFVNVLSQKMPPVATKPEFSLTIDYVEMLLTITFMTLLRLRSHKRAWFVCVA